MSDVVIAAPLEIVTDDEIVSFADGAVVLRHDGSPPAHMRKRIDEFVGWAVANGFDDPANEPHVEHELIDGMYVRKLFIPKGSWLIGKIHLKDCVNVVALGDITVLTELGCRRVQAGFSQGSPAGLQKIGFAHEDTIFLNVFRTDKADLAEIEAEIASAGHPAADNDKQAQGLLKG